ncbi:PPC domain-containing protein, partial [Candidatus Sumerlaeota bacterium]|nr:PPC domain-containing protein [Candidatus Sumerlaeota bacterium]
MRFALPALAALAATAISAAGAQPNDTVIERADTIHLGQTRTGQLEASDETREGGQHFDVWRFTASAGDELTIDLVSDAIDTYLILLRPDGTRFDNDDRAWGDYNSRISQRMPLDGVYHLQVSSYGAGEIGPYMLTMSEGMPVPADPSALEVERPAIPLTIGQRVSGSLSAGDSRQHSGRYLDEYTFEGEPGQSLTIDMISAGIDCHLTLIAPDGERTINDDMEPGNLNSRIETILALEGTYRLRASSYAPDEKGAYTLLALDNTHHLRMGEPIREWIGDGTDEMIFRLEGVSEDLGCVTIQLGGDGGDLDLEALCRREEGDRSAPGHWITAAASRSLSAHEEVVFGTHHRPPHLIRVTLAGGESAGFSLSAMPTPASETLPAEGLRTGSLTAESRSQLFEIASPVSGHLIALAKTKGGAATLRMATGRHRSAGQGAEPMALVPVTEGERVTLLLSSALAGENVEYILETHLAAAAESVLADHPADGRIGGLGPRAAVHPVTVQSGHPLELILEPAVSSAGPLQLFLLRSDTGELITQTDVRHGNPSLMASVAPGTPCEALVMTHSADNASLAYRLSVREGAEATVGTLPLDSSDPAVAVFEPGTRSSTTWMLRPRRSGLFQVTATPSGFLDTRVALEVATPGGPTRHTEGDTDTPARAVFLAEEGQSTAMRVFDPLGMAQDAVQVSTVTLTRAPLAPAWVEGDEPAMWGLFTGVADYPSSPLPHCDDDAENLLSALLAQRSIRRDHVILLTNEQVTRAAIRASFEAIRDR